MAAPKNGTKKPPLPPAGEQIFHLLFENHPSPMWIYDLETLAFLAVNDAALRRYGYRRDEFMGLTLKDIRPAEDVPRLLEDVAQERPPWQQSGAWRHRLKDGTIIDVEITSHTLEFKGREAALVMAQDITARKQTEETLRQNEEVLRLFIEHAPAAIAMFDRHMNYLAASRRWLADYNLGEQNIIGRSHYEIFPEVPERWQVIHRRGLSGEVVRAEEDRFERFDGTVHWERWEVRPWSRPDGTIGGIIIFTEDVTERKQAEHALQRSRDRLSLAIEVTGLGIYEHAVPLDNDTFHSERWAEILGYELSELPPPAARQEWVLEQVHPDDLSTIVTAYRDFIEGRTQGWNVEIRMKHKSGQWVWVNGYSKAIERNESGQVTRILGVIQDITGRKQREEESRLKDELLRMTGEMAKVGGWEFDAQTLKGTWTDEVARIHDLDPDQPTNVELGLSFYLPESREKIERAIKEAIELAKPYELELEMVSAKGIHKWVTTMGLPITDGEKVIKVRGIFQDITERKQLEADHEQLTEQFYQAQKMESVGRLAGGIAHDFNNLLVPIIGYAELGLMNLSPDEGLYVNFVQIKEAGERATDLTRQILAFSRQQVLEMQVLDLNLVISDFKQMLQRMIGEDIELRTMLTPSPYPVKADRGQIEQILMNLAVNARDAMPTGGKLAIETANVFLDEQYAAKHAETRPGPHLMLAVSDTGQGMDAETQQRIFDPFFTTKERGKGTGLGLATVFGIVKQHQGNIWVYSESDSGTTFKIYLPKSTATTPTGEAAIDDSGSVLGTETILVVEDEEMVRGLVCETLEAYGYHIIEATSPAHCLQLASSYKDTIDLLLTDVIMPEMNGRDLYQKLAEFHPDSSVLYMSGYTDDVIVHHGILEEGVNFLQKPFTVPDLMRKVRQALS